MNVVGPDGKPVWVDDADLQQASNAGYRPASPEEVSKAKVATEAAEQPVRAALEGVARTASFGVSDKLIQGFDKGYQDPRALKARKEENPIASTVGEIAGFAVPGPKFGALGRFAGGAVEGGLRGLGTAISEDAMGDPGLASEHYVAGTFGGALAGGAANVVFGKVGDLGKSALVKAFGGKALTEHLGEMAENQVMRSVMNPSDLGKKHLRGRANEVGRFALDEGFTKGGATFAQASERAKARADQAWQGMEQALDAADASVKFDARKLTPKLLESVKGLEHNPAMADVKAGLESFIAKVDSPDLGPDTFKNAWKTTASMLRQATDKQTPGTLKDELFKLRQDIQEGMAEQMPKDLAASFRKASDEYAHSATFRDLAMKKADAVAAGGGGLTDAMYAAGAVAHAGPLGLAAPFVTKALRERGGFVLGSALDAMSQSKVLQRMADGFKKSLTGNLKANPMFGGVFRQALETAAAKGSIDLLQMHTQNSHDPEYMAAVGLQHEDPAAVPGYADKAHRLGQMYNAVDAGNAEIEKSIGRVLGEQPGRAPSVKKQDPTPETLAKITGQLKVLTGENEALGRHLGDTAPNTAAMAAGGVAAGAQYLLDHSPKNPFEGLPPALQRPYQPPKDVIRTWLRRVEAVADPRSVFDNMRDGTVTPEAIDALKTVYPRMYQDFRERMMNRLADWKEPLPREKRAQIGQLLGDMEDRKVAQLIQQGHLRQTLPPEAGGAPGPDGRQVVDAEKNQMTQAQRLEGRQGQK